jgi:hypothetical protein
MAPASGLARTVDLHYPTNRAIVVLFAAVVIGDILVRYSLGMGVTESLLGGILSGIAVFLAWALARELDPDDDYAAFASAGLMIVALAVFPFPDLIFSLLVLLLLRIVNRTTGIPSHPLDTAAVLVLTAWPLFKGFISGGAATTAALLLDSRLSNPTRRNLWAAGLAVLETVIFFPIVGMRAGPAGLYRVAALLIASLLFLPVVFGSRRVVSLGDVTGEPLDSVRVRAAQVLGLATADAAVFIGGSALLVALLPLWAGLLGTGLFRIGSAITGFVHRHAP